MKAPGMPPTEKEFNDLMGQLAVGEAMLIVRFMKLLKNPGFLAEYKANIPEGWDCLPRGALVALMDKWEATA